MTRFILLCANLTLLLHIVVCQIATTGLDNALDTMIETVVDTDHETRDMLMNNLERFGYLPISNEILESLQDERNITDALMMYQRLGNIDQTGVLDNETVQLLHTPRCGVPDVLPFSASSTKWPTNQIRYRFGQLTPDLQMDVVRSEIWRALQVWADVTSLTFIEVGPGEETDINIMFGSGEHGDGIPFDGRGGVLAHAFLPRHGDAHFDDSETWTINTFYGINLFQVAAHEFGHSLGLYHSRVASALMYPYYRGYQPNFQLDQDDILGIQSLYGPNVPEVTTTRTPATTTTSPTIPTTSPPSTTSPPTISPPGRPIPRGACSGSLEASFTDSAGRIFALTDTYYWRFDVSPPFHGRVQTRFGSAFPDVVDAAFKDTRYTYLFSGCYVYRYDGFQFRGSYPFNRRWVGVPCDIDAIFKSIDGFTYFFKGRFVYKFQDDDWRSRRRISTSGFRNMPSALYDGVDAISTFPNGSVYFFRNGLYYRMADGAKRFESTTYDVIEDLLPICRNVNQETCS